MDWDQRYAVDDASGIESPGMVIFADHVDANISRMIEIAGSTDRLRPHCKTHKMPTVARRQLELGITKHKAATFAEAEMLAEAGIKDVFLAYNLVGPNLLRAVAFRQRFPEVTLSVTADHSAPIRQLGEAFAGAGLTIEVLLDIDTGQHRTGVPVGDGAKHLYGLIAETPGLLCGGLHVYDGHQHQASRDDRRKAVMQEWQRVLEFHAGLKDQGWPVPRVVAGGTGSFPIYAELELEGLECSPGTCVLHDAGYGAMFQDLEFVPAALILTRVISRPTEDRVTLDLGYKAVASDPPAGQRLVFPTIPDAEEVLQNEEHLVVRTSKASEFEPGDELYALPRHVCPTSALHRSVWVIRDGQVVDQWEVTARDRKITI